MMFPKAKIGDKLQSILEERGLTQRYVAEKAGMGTGHFCNIYNNKRRCTPAALIQIARALDLKPNDLLDLKKDENSDVFNLQGFRPLVIGGWLVPNTHIIFGGFEDHLNVVYEYIHKKQVYPRDLEKKLDRYVQTKTEQISRANEERLNPQEIATKISTQKKQNVAVFFNGPCTRLLGISLAESYQNQNGKEETVVKAMLGPVSWFEYTFLNQKIDEKTFPDGQSVREKFADPNVVLKSPHDLSTLPLSNILATTTTPITSDGYALIVERSDYVSTQGSNLASGIAENIHRFKDDSKNQDIDFSREQLQGQAGSPVDVNYAPKGYPSPDKAIIRGIYEEFSTEIYRLLRHKDVVKVLSFVFDFKIFHPYLVSVIDLPWTRKETQALMDEYPPADEHEYTSRRFIKLDWKNSETRDLLKDGNWGTGGQAAVVFALKYYANKQRRA